MSPQPTETERIAALHQQAAADYDRAQQQRAANEAAASGQLALARVHAQETAGARR